MKICSKCGSAMVEQKEVKPEDLKKSVTVGFAKFDVPMKIKVYVCKNCKHIDEYEVK